MGNSEWCAQTLAVDTRPGSKCAERETATKHTGFVICARPVLGSQLAHPNDKRRPEDHTDQRLVGNAASARDILHCAEKRVRGCIDLGRALPRVCHVAVFVFVNRITSVVLENGQLIPVEVHSIVYTGGAGGRRGRAFIVGHAPGARMELHSGDVIEGLNSWIRTLHSNRRGDCTEVGEQRDDDT
jgi:hypothetical protein